MKPTQRRFTISVIIPAHNERDYIPHILTTLQGQTRLPDEIVVVCDRCTDDTAAVAYRCFAAFPASVQGRTVSADCGDIGGARNAGIQTTTGDIVVCLDADTLLHPQVLERVEQAVENGAFFGGFRMVPDDRFRRAGHQQFLNRIWLGGINLCARTLGNFVGTGSFFRRVPGLLYDGAWGWGEDIEFCGRARKIARQQGATYAYIEDAPLVYCDRRFIERGYSRELLRRLQKGLDHLQREQRRHVNS